MELALLVYLGSVLDDLEIAMVWLMLLSFVVTLGASAMYLDSFHLDEECLKPIVKWIKRCAVISLSCLTMSIVIPSKTDYYIMLGAYVGQQVATDEKTTKLFDKTMKLIEQQIDEALTEEVK